MCCLINRCRRGGAAGAILLGLLLACQSSSDERTVVTLSGIATLDSSAPPERLLVVAQTLDARTLAAAPTDAEGRYTLTFTVPDGTRRLLVGALLPAEPGRRSLAVVDVLGDRAQGLRLGTARGALGDAGATATFDVDERSTASALVLATTGDLEREIQSLQQRYAGEIEGLAGLWSGAQVSVCSAGPSGVTAGTQEALREILRGVAAENPPNAEASSLMQQLFQRAAGGGTVEERLRAMQQAVSKRVWSGNAPRLRGNVDFVVGLLGVPLARAALAAQEGEEFLGGIREDDVAALQLRRIATIISQSGWGNCREKAYMGAYLASLVPEIKQIAIVGVGRHGKGDHAVAIACLDDVDVYDLSDMWVTDSSQPGYQQMIPRGVEGRCWVVDPWLGPASNPVAGHVGAFGRDYTTTYAWQELVAFRRVRLTSPKDHATRTFELERGSGVFHCSGDGGCEPFLLPEPPAPAVDAGPGPGPDASVCPTYEPDGASCGASLDGCIQGFYCSRETIACEQETCPAGSGRTYTLECCCTCWGDTSVVDVYDPCRAGFLLRCDPAP